jgi:hypothetical protein
VAEVHRRKTMDTTSERIQSCLNRADEIAMAEVERLARQVLKRCTSFDEFVMGMGIASFTLKDGRSVFTGEVKAAKKLNDFLSRWDRDLKLTGSPIRFTAEGKAYFDW